MQSAVVKYLAMWGSYKQYKMRAIAIKHWNCRKRHEEQTNEEIIADILLMRADLLGLGSALFFFLLLDSDVGSGGDSGLIKTSQKSEKNNILQKFYHFFTLITLKNS